MQENRILDRIHSKRVLLFSIVVVLAIHLGNLSAQEENQDDIELGFYDNKTPLLERDPFDRIFLDKASNDRILDVRELKLSTSLNPADHPGTETLKFYLLVDGVNRYQVPWRHVKSIETYSQMLLKEIRKNLNDKNPATREKALSNTFKLLDRILRDPKMRSDSRVQEYLREYLYEDAYYSFQNNQLQEAWTTLDELFILARDYRPSASVPTVVNMLSQLIDKRMGEMVKKQNYRAAEALMESIRRKYGNTQTAVNQKWQNEIIADAKREEKKAIAAFQAGDGRAAHDAVRRMLNVYPSIEGGKLLFKSILEKFPLVFVGVTDKAEIGNPKSLLSWAERRKGALYYRNIVEYVKQGQDGGIYRFPYGDIEVGADLKSIHFAFRSDIEDPALPPLNAYSLRKRLLDLADPSKPDYSPVWDELIESTFAQNPKRLTINLKQRHVRPEALLQICRVPFDPKNPPPPNAYYIEKESKNIGKSFVPNPAYEGLKPLGLPQIVEVFFKDSEQQTNALLRGDIDIIDRVFPAQVRRLKKNPLIEVVPYTIPTVHVLIPNLRTRHMKSTIFRTALIYGIKRPDILYEGILADNPLQGFEVISGAVPHGISDSDPIGYAYDPKINPLVADPRIGIVQAAVGDNQIKLLIERLNKNLQDKNDPNVKLEVYTPLDKLTFKLCHPANEIARVACTRIKLDLKLLGINVELKELEVGETYPPDNDFDLLYAEITMQEPLLDVRAILSPEGLARTDNDAINQAIRFLDTAKSWREATPRLHELHSLCYHNSVVIPLWQIVEHYAYRKNVRGVGKKINSLYRNVVEWKIGLDVEGDSN